jgi:hypothetical protein
MSPLTTHLVGTERRKGVVQHERLLERLEGAIHNVMLGLVTHL